jgi:hypothetical protein
LGAVGPEQLVEGGVARRRERRHDDGGRRAQSVGRSYRPARPIR